MVITQSRHRNVEIKPRHRCTCSIFLSIRRLSLATFLSRKAVFTAAAGTEPSSQSIYGEKYLRRLLWYLLGGTRGGPNRVQILKALRERPLNANQLAGVVHLDYKTIEHHLNVLEENGLVTFSEKGAYGAVLFLTPRMEEAWSLLEEIWGKIGRTKISTTDRRE
jgi:DNA-binding transcriptional ArsR family regulator